MGLGREEMIRGTLQIIGNFRSFGKGINKPLPYPAREIFLFRSEVVTVVVGCVDRVSCSARL